LESLPNREKNRGGTQIPITMTGYTRFTLLRLEELSPMGTLGGTGIIIDVSGMKVLEEN
jgi:hypothetical protein